jgi:acetylglutamate kinase
LLNNQVTPVCCAITVDKSGQLLNTNADTIAAEIAKALAKMYRVTLWYCFEKKGVLENVDDDESVIDHLTLSKYESMLASNQIHTGMLPKLKNCFDALAKGVDAVYITNQDGLSKLPDSSGTKISET